MDKQGYKGVIDHWNGFGQLSGRWFFCTGNWVLLLVWVWLEDNQAKEWEKEGFYSQQVGRPRRIFPKVVFSPSSLQQNWGNFKLRIHAYLWRGLAKERSVENWGKSHQCLRAQRGLNSAMTQDCVLGHPLLLQQRWEFDPWFIVWNGTARPWPGSGC